MRARRAGFSRVVLLVLLVGQTALAQTRAAKREAAVRFQRGISLYKDGNFAAALAEFRAAHRAAPNYEVLYNIGLCERRLYKYGDAVKNLESYLSLGRARVPRDRREAVARELSEIRALTAEVTVTVAGGPADVTIDGEPVGSSPFQEPFLLGPGKKVFRASREGEAPAEKVEEIVSGTRVEIQLAPRSLEVEPAELSIESIPAGGVVTVDGKAAGLAPVTLTVPPGGHTVVVELSGYRSARQEAALAAGQKRHLVVPLDAMVVEKKVPFPVAGTVVAAGGLAAIAGAVGLNFAGQEESRKVSELYQTGGTWDDRYVAIEAAGQADQSWSIVLGIAGGVALATGALLTVVTLASGPGSEPEEADSESVSLMLAPLPHGGGFASLSVRF